MSVKYLETVFRAIKTQLHMHHTQSQQPMTFHTKEFGNFDHVYSMNKIFLCKNDVYDT